MKVTEGRKVTVVLKPGEMVEVRLATDKDVILEGGFQINLTEEYLLTVRETSGVSDSDGRSGTIWREHFEPDVPGERQTIRPNGDSVPGQSGRGDSGRNDNGRLQGGRNDTDVSSHGV